MNKLQKALKRADEIRAEKSKINKPSVDELPTSMGLLYNFYIWSLNAGIVLVLVSTIYILWKGLTS